MIGEPDKAHGFHDPSVQPGMKSVFNSQREDTRYKILELLKLGGPQTVDELSHELAISSMGVRQHLVMLESEGLIFHRSEKRGIGRPSYVYQLAEQGDEMFPRQYVQLALDLIQAVQALEGEKGLERLFAERNRLYVERYRAQMAGKDLKGQVAELARLRTQEGFMADWSTINGNTFQLRERNCALYQIAVGCPEACSFELSLFQEALDGAEITREAHILSGDQACTYRIQG